MPFKFRLPRFAHLSSFLASIGLAVGLCGGGFFFVETNGFLDRQAEHEADRRLAVSLRLALQGAQDMETSQRGFLLTGQDIYLQPFDYGHDTALSSIAKFSTLSMNRPEHGLAAELLDTLKAKDRELRQTIELRRQGHLDQALNVMALGEGKRLMDRYRLLIDRQLGFYVAEQARLQEQTVIRLRSAKIAFAIWLTSFGALLCFALVSSRLAQRRLRELSARLAKEASHDALTGLPNRRYLDEELSRLVAGATRRGEALCALYMDLDGFSQINNTLGHAAGDEALRKVCETFERCLRDCDFLARVGGDEFVVICPQTTAIQASSLATRLIEAVNALTPLEEAPAGILGVSVGIAAFPESAAERSALLVAADEAMYDAKRAGKRVARHAPPLKA
jgi:diguanylate cyclase (GGDEF)-like protein